MSLPTSMLTNGRRTVLRGVGVPPACGIRHNVARPSVGMAGMHRPGTTTPQNGVAGTLHARNVHVQPVRHLPGDHVQMVGGIHAVRIIVAQACSPGRGMASLSNLMACRNRRNL